MSSGPTARLFFRTGRTTAPNPLSPPQLPLASIPHTPAQEPLQRRTMSVLVVTQIIGTVGAGIAPSIGVLLAGEVTDNESWAGLARTASTLGAALLGLPLGALAGRFGRRIALSCGWWIAAAGSALLVLAAQQGLLIPLFLGLLMIGAGSAVSLQSRFAATDLAQPRHKARSLALIVWVGTIGSVLGPNLGAPGKLVGDLLGLNVYAGAFLIAASCLFLAGPSSSPGCGRIRCPPCSARPLTRLPVRRESSAGLITCWRSCARTLARATPSSRSSPPRSSWSRS